MESSPCLHSLEFTLLPRRKSGKCGRYFGPGPPSPPPDAHGPARLRWGCGSDSRSLFASLTPHPAANGIIVIHKQDFMRNWSFGRSHTALPLVTNNDSVTQVHSRKCIKLNRYRNRQQVLCLRLPCRLVSSEARPVSNPLSSLLCLPGGLSIRCPAPTMFFGTAPLLKEGLVCGTAFCPSVW